MFDDLRRESVADAAAGFVPEGGLGSVAVVVVVANVVESFVGDDDACGGEEEGEGDELHCYDLW